MCSCCSSSLRLWISAAILHFTIETLHIYTPIYVQDLKVFNIFKLFETFKPLKHMKHFRHLKHLNILKCSSVKLFKMKVIIFGSIARFLDDI